MDKIRQIFQIAVWNFYGWNRNLRVWMTFLLTVVLCLMLSDEVLSYSRQYETALQLLEPFIWTYGDASSVMLSSLLLILLFADIPFITQVTPYELIRTKRSIWLAGQMVYVILTTLIYNIFLFMVQAIFAAPYAFMGNVWSKTAAMLGYGGATKDIIPVSVKTMENTLPLECALQVFLLMLCYLLFIAAVMLCGHLLFGSYAGIIGAFAVNLFGFLLNPGIFQSIFHLTGNLEYRANVICGWLSPLNHATFPMHNFGYDYLPQIWQSISSFIVGIIVLFVISMKQMQRYNFSYMQTED